MTVDPATIRALGKEAVQRGWNATSLRLPKQVAAKAKAAAMEVPLIEPSEKQMRSAVRVQRMGFVALLLVCAIPAGIAAHTVLSSEQRNGGSWAALVLFSLPLLFAVIVVSFLWKVDPRRAWIENEQAQILQRTNAGIREVARALLPQPTPIAPPAMTPRPKPVQPPPIPTWFRPRHGFVDSRDAEYLAAEVMTKLGCRSVQVTPASRDGGLDVEAAGWVAEVKHHSSPVPASYLHRIYGVAQSRSSRAMFFAWNGYRPEAKAFGESTGMLLFTYDPSTGSIAAHSSAARNALRDGMSQ